MQLSLMASRAERREIARFEAGAKLAVFAVAAVALAIGGVTGFAQTFAALAILAVGALAVAGIGYLILNSKLVARKKTGLMLILIGSAMALFWSLAKAPKQWREERAVVTSVKGPTAVTETTYVFHPGKSKSGQTLAVTQTKEWPKLADAQKFKPAPITVYYNRSNFSEVRFEATSGWGRAAATPTSVQVRKTGEATAILRLGSPLFPKTASTTGSHAEEFVHGASVSVWINPVARDQLSFQPRATEGGQKYWILAIGVAAVLCGTAAVAVGKQWMDTSDTSAIADRLPSVDAGVFYKPKTVAEMLRGIDWFQFEAVAARILESEGWSVKKNGGAKADGGADLIATRNGRKAVVQCKHWKRIEVQPNIVRQLIGTKFGAQFKADEAMLFSLSECTVAARAEAKQNDITIYNAGMIEKAIQGIGLDKFPELTNPDDKSCPKCGARMVLRDKVVPPFWGCSTFPRCRGVIERA
ncbi:MAG: restriction endonuclease [Opitutae bacterium]|nr:restriction endonuclease [Opitutae bacterium]